MSEKATVKPAPGESGAHAGYGVVDNKQTMRGMIDTSGKEAISVPTVGPQPRPEGWDRCVCDYVNPVVSRVRQRPFFQKVIIANTLLIALGSFTGYYLESRYMGQGKMGFVGLFFISSIALSILINYILVKIAFRPLDDVADAMKAIRAGHRGVRVPEVTDDPQIEELSRSLNSMLNSMELQRKRAAASVIQAQEEERKRIARELHDETSQSLTSLIIGLRMVEETLPDTESVARERLESISELAHDMLNEVHTMAIRLRPSVLDDLGLAAAIRSFSKEFAQNTGIKVDVELMSMSMRLSPEMETVLYRVIQEALTNIARHAGAENCRVTLRRREEVIQGIIEDDGRGFDPQQVLMSDEKGRGLGLHGMKERIELVGGSLEFESRMHEGTTIFLEVPL